MTFFLPFLFQSNRSTQYQETHSTLKEKKGGGDGIKLMKFKATNLLIVLYLLKVSVKWPSEKYPRERELNDDLAALGVALVRGTYTQMATAIFKIKPLKQSIIQCLLKELSRECANLTSKKNPSILRKTSTDDMRNFKLENVAKELSTRAPLLYSTLLTTAVRDQVKTTLPSVALAACILLKERSPHLNAAQILMSVIMKFSGSQVNSCSAVLICGHFLFT